MEKSGEGNKINIWVYIILAAAFIIAVIWGFSSVKSAKALENNINNQYNRAFHELVDYMDNIDTYLSKAQLSKSPAQLASVSSDIFRESAQAKSALGQLPVSDVNLEKVSKFLSQVGDYTYVLSHDMINGTQITDEDLKNLKSLNEYAAKLKDALFDMQKRVYSGEINFAKVSVGKKKRLANTAQAAGEDVLADLENVEKSFDEYPSLIYDGPFSEHIENREPSMTKGKAEIDRSEALDRAKNFLGNKSEGLQYESDTQNTKIPSYTFVKNTDGEQMSISVTKNGGYILSYLSNRSVKEAKLDVSEATQKAAAFLNEHGYTDMISSYYEKSNNTATINFAYSKNDIIHYSDLIKVRIALDNGEILGIEANGYITNHAQRNLSEPKLTEKEAREKVSSNLNVTATGLALIPKDSMKEVLCYEFKGTFADKNFIVYINADNGHEEDILLLIESENGILTI